MPFAICDGIATRYEILGDGPPLVMFSPGGVNATIEQWSALGVYAKVKPLEWLSRHYSCIVFDRRECGQSGGRIERVTYRDYVNQAIALMDHLKIGKAHIMGGCMGCCPVTTMATQSPERIDKMILWWPVGGAKYRISSHQRMAQHLAFVESNGLRAVADLVQETGKPFNADPRGGPWASVLKHDPAFTADYVKQDNARYRALCAGIIRTLFDRDTAPGAEPEDLMQCALPALIVPGRDDSHATSAARYLEECLPNVQYWDMPVAGQTRAASEDIVLEFLAGKAA